MCRAVLAMPNTTACLIGFLPINPHVPLRDRIFVEGLDLAESLDVFNLSHSSRPQRCSGGWVEYAALTPISVATRVEAAEGEDLPAQHPEAGSELGLCLQRSDSSMAMKQLK